MRHRRRRPLPFGGNTTGQVSCWGARVLPRCGGDSCRLTCPHHRRGHHPACGGRRRPTGRCCLAAAAGVCVWLRRMVPLGLAAAGGCGAARCQGAAAAVGGGRLHASPGRGARRRAAWMPPRPPVFRPCAHAAWLADGLPACLWWLAGRARSKEASKLQQAVRKAARAKIIAWPPLSVPARLVAAQATGLACVI